MPRHARIINTKNAGRAFWIYDTLPTLQPRRHHRPTSHLDERTTMKPPKPDPDHLDRLLTERDAADFLGYSARTLQNCRVRGGGPVFIKVSSRSIRYRRRDLMAWAESKLAEHTSTLPEKGLRHG